MSSANAVQREDGLDAFGSDELTPGTELLHGQYRIERLLNAGGFGMTYLAKDSPDRRVVIKECFPGAFCRRKNLTVQAHRSGQQANLQSIVSLFVQEARSLAKLSHPGIVKVHQVFEDNGTAYMVLDLIEGADLMDVIESGRSFPPDQTRELLRKLIDAVVYIHDRGMLHRDISPDNILIDREGSPVLIDFGAAREQAARATRVLSTMRVVKDGYSPQQFYVAGSSQDPSSDFYSLAATVYQLIAGETSTNSQLRLAAIAAGDPDPYVLLSGRASSYDGAFLAAVDKSLSVFPKDRMRTGRDWLQAVGFDMAELEEPSSTGADAALKVSRPVNRTSSTPTNSIATASALVTAPFKPKAGREGKVALLSGLAAFCAVAALFGLGTVIFSDPPIFSDPASDTLTQQTLPTGKAVPAADTATPAMRRPLIVANRPSVIRERAPTATGNFAPNDTAPEQPAAVAEPSKVASSLVLASPKPVTEAAVAPQPPPVPTRAATASDDPIAVDPPVAIEVSAVMSNWAIDVPFTTSPDALPTIAAADPGARQWARPGQRVHAVNGVEIGTIDDIDTIAREGQEPDAERLVALTPTIADDATEQSIEALATMPIVQNTLLLDGSHFVTRFDNGSWRTVVRALPPRRLGDMEVGDIVLGDVATNQKLDGRATMRDILSAAVGAGTGTLNFAVERNGAMWVVTIPNPSADTN